LNGFRFRRWLGQQGSLEFGKREDFGEGKYRFFTLGWRWDPAVDEGYRHIVVTVLLVGDF
jgi:hypothetical protein